MSENSSVTSMFIEKFGYYIAFIASIITIIVFLFQIFPSKLEITVDEYYSSNPTNIVSAPDLVGKFTYKGKKIKDLFVSHIRIKNTGNKTLIGEGLKKNIIKKSLLFSIPKSYKILSVESVYKKISFETKIVGRNTFKVMLSQLRSNEEIEIKIYIEKTNNKNVKLTIESQRRDLIDGDIIINSSKNIRNKNKLYEVFGYRAYNILFFIGVISLISSFFIYLLIPLTIIRNIFKLRYWKKKNQKEFNAFVDQEFYESEELLKTFVKQHPERLEKLIWKKFNRSSAKNYVIGSHKKLFYPAMIMFVFLSLGSLIILFYVL